MEEVKKNSVFSMFQANEMSFDDAQKKAKEESGEKVQYFKMANDGEYVMRLLPLAPVIDMDGNLLPMDRKGYEYPSRGLFLGIKTEQKDKGGKPKTITVKIGHVKQAFPNVESDLIDKYVELACSKYASDKAVCDKIKSNSFSGGLKWSHERNVYVLDATDEKTRALGPQLLSLSFSQYKTLEEMKMSVWAKLNKNGKSPCPISSINAAFKVEIRRKTENRKVGYSFNIDTLSGVDALTEKYVNALIDAPRLPEVLYKSTRRQLDATFLFLEQYDQDSGIDVMGA